jgi:hypothetical protein
VLVSAEPSSALETVLRLEGKWDTPAPPRNPAELAQRIQGSAGALEIMTFVVSDDHFALRQQLGLSVSP